MKWIGQHIWDFISRFRTTVYLENLETSSEENVLVVDSDGKITKNTTLGGADLTYNGSTANGVLTYGGASVIDVESELTYASGSLNIQNSSLSSFVVANTGDSTVGGGIILKNSRGGSDGQDGDILGTISFTGVDDGTPSTHVYGKIQGTIADATSGQEAGKLTFYVAEYDGTTTTAGLTLNGDTNADGEIDVTIGAGAASTTTVAGTLTMGSTAAMTNAGLVSVAAQTNITSLGTLTNLQVDDVNINTKSIQILGDTGDTFNITTGAAGATTMTTVDAGGAVGHLSLIADGDTIVQTTDGLASKNFKINNGSNTAFLFNGESGNISKLTIYEQGGDSADDFFTIQVEEHGATTIQATDGGGSNANLQITADGTAELAGTTVTLDSAANVELEVGATTNYVQTTGIFRGSNIGTIQDTLIPVLPTDFNNPSSFRYPVNVGATGAYVTASSSSINYIAQKIIPKGYTATSCTIYGSDTDANSQLRCYETNIDGSAASAVVGATTISSGAWTMSFTSNIVGDGEKVCTIYFDPGDTTDRIYGGKIEITKTT